MIQYNEIQKYYFSTLINDSQYQGVFGTKELGDGRKVEMVINFLRKLNVNFDKVVVLDQIHSANINYFQKTNNQLIEKIEQTDGVITNSSRTVLTTITADCQPIIFVDKHLGLIGISHQGWRGSIKRLPQKMVQTMKKHGSKPKNIIVALGPSIGQCCYDIDEERYYQFLEEFDGYSDKIFSFSGGKRYLSLNYLNYLLLVETGIKKENIDFYPFCTFCQKKHFFSLRREKKNLRGEMLNLVVKFD